MAFRFALLWIGLAVSLLALGASHQDDASEVDSLDNSVSTPAPLVSGSPSLTMGLRIDADFEGGGAIDQGFSIPSLLLSASGDVVQNVDYRLSLGQTKEFSTALIPQILPVEAYMEWHSENQLDNFDGSAWHFRFGMFSPSLNPWFTPDLSYLDLPDYNEVDRAVLLSRDIGAELSYYPWGQNVELALGAFNGVGVETLNTNNAKAFTGYARVTVPFGGWQLLFGSGGYYSSQSSSGSVNYRQSNVGDVFLSLQVPIGLTLSLEGFSSHFAEATAVTSPTGAAVFATQELNSWLAIFGRLESATNSPVMPGPITQVELGPMIEWTPALKGFLFYRNLVSNYATEHIVELRFRLTL